jgi:serine/threonine-protein kinase
MKVCPVCSTEYGDDVRFCKNDGAALRGSAGGTDLVGQIVAERYHIVKKLGEGGMGQVYLAEHVKMGRRSAIKVVNPSMVHDPDTIARFNREAANASRITHPHVCAVYDFGETADGLVYLVMEFVDGEPLSHILEREGALPLNRAGRIFLQAADALQAAHELGIVHRDLKPDNIMVARGRDGEPLVKVVDFGIAKAVEAGAGAGDQKVTKTGLVIGTPEFMSPEQLAGDKVDGRSDIYSLALVFFRMVTGILPFKADTIQEMMVKRLTDDPLTLAQAAPGSRFPPGLQTALDSALARTPHTRYESVGAFAVEVAGALGIDGGRAPAQRPPDEARTQVLTASAPTPTARLGVRSTPATRPSAPPVPASRARRSMLPAGIVLVLLAAAGGAMALLGRRGESPSLRATDTARLIAPRSDSISIGSPTPTETRARESSRPRAAADARRLDVAAVDELLLRLIEAPPRIAVDSAALVYNTPGVSRKDRAFAACLAAQHERALRNTDRALAWADSGLALDNSLSACRSVVQELRGAAGGA